jgi:hypothetical protein
MRRKTSICQKSAIVLRLTIYNNSIKKSLQDFFDIKSAVPLKELIFPA